MPLNPEKSYALASKPLLWSTNGYLEPGGPKVQGGFVKQFGYGGEEWNGDEDREVNGFRYFSSESKPKLDMFAEHGHLGLLMTATFKGTQYIVGIACGVSTLSDKESDRIAKRFKLKALGENLWSRPWIQA